MNQQQEEVKAKLATIEADFVESLQNGGLTESAAKTYFASIRKMVRHWLLNGSVTADDLADHEAMLTPGYANTFRVGWRKFASVCQEAGIEIAMPREKLRTEVNQTVASVARFVNGRLSVSEMREARWGDVTRDSAHVYVAFPDGKYSFFGPVAHHAFDMLALWGHKTLQPPANASLFPPRTNAVEPVSAATLKAWISAGKALRMPDDRGLEIDPEILDAVRTVLASGIPACEVVLRVLNEPRVAIPDRKRPEPIEQKVVDEKTDEEVEQAPIAVKMPSFDEWRRNR
jgi:hypothetical protein